MKKLLSLFLLFAGLALISCSGGGGLSAKAKKNKAVNDSIMKAYERGDFSKMTEYLAADAIDHGGETGDIKGVENIVAEMKKYRASMPDMKMTLIRELADDEYVMTWSTVTGTMNGKETTMTGLDVSKFKDGKAVEHWTFMDPREVMTMMQSMPGIGTGTDTTHQEQKLKEQSVRQQPLAGSETMSTTGTLHLVPFPLIIFTPRVDQPQPLLPARQ